MDPIRFAKIYQGLVTTAESQELVMQLELAFNLNMKQIQETRSEAIAAMSDKQAREMDSASQLGQHDRIPTLVNKHLIEMDQLESKWNSDISEAKSRQRAEYQAFLLNLDQNATKYTAPPALYVIPQSQTDMLEQLQSLKRRCQHQRSLGPYLRRRKWE